MKNYKRVVAFAMAATMMVGSGVTAMAAEGGATGSGDYEGYVEETSVFTVVVPTDASATAGFNFFVDPNGLLAQTDYASKGGNAEEFDTNSTLFFTRTVASGDTTTKKYGNESDAITFTNKSSYDVDVEVAATVTGADKITLGTVADDTADPTIQLAIVSGTDEAKITADGGKLTGTIQGTDDNFEIKWNSTDSKYEYGLKDNVGDDTWKTYSFNLTGACGGTWTGDQAEVQPTVNLTWKVTDPKATPTTPTTTATSITAGGDAVEIAIPDGITITAVEKTKADGTYNALPADYFTWDDIEGGKKLTLKANFKSQFGTGKKIKISFSQGDPIELNVLPFL